VLIASGAVVALVAAASAVLGVLAPVRHALVVVLFGVVLAFVLDPLVGRLERLVRRRALATVMAFLAFLIGVVAVLTLIARPLADEAGDIIRRVPEYTDALRRGEPLSLVGLEIPSEVRQEFGQLISERGGELAAGAAGAALRVSSAVVDIVLVLVLAIYLSAGARKIRAFLIAWVPERHRESAARIEDELAVLFGRYVRAQLLLAVIVGGASVAAYSSLGLRHALVLGLLAGVLELVPIVGPIVAGTVAAGLALFQPWPLVAWVVVAAIAIQQLENNVLVPRISGAAVGLPPVAALLAVLFGIEIAGIVGGMVAVPLVGAVARLVSAIRRERSAPA